MREQLEDILGGVEEEIRRAEARLNIKSFQRSSGGSIASPRPGDSSLYSGYDHETGSKIWSSELVSKQTIRRTIKGVASETERRKTTRGRRRAWAHVENESQCASDDPGVIGSGDGGCESPEGRAALVNRLLEERDARLRSSAISGATCKGARKGEAGSSNRFGYIHEDSVSDLPDELSRGQSMTLDHGSRASKCELDASPVGEKSPASSSKIFFASDLLRESSGIHGRAQDVGSINMRELETGIFGHDRDSGTEDASGTDAEEKDLCRAGAGGYQTGRRVAGQMMRQGSSREGRRAENMTTRETLDFDGRAAVCGCRPGAARARMHDKAKQERRRSRQQSIAEQVEDQMTSKSMPNNRESGEDRQRQSGRSESRIEELARDRQQTYSDRERKRKEMQEEENKECTFHPKFFVPKVVRMDAVSNPDTSQGTRLPVYERLHKEAREREAARALAQRHLEAELLRECTFQPALTIAEARTPVEQRPLHQRVWEVERQREHKLRLLQAEKEEREGATFAPPPLGRVSERLARDARPEVAATGASGHRLASGLQMETRRANERRRQRLREYEAAEARLSTFEPCISRGTERLVKKRPELQAPFEERGALMEARKREREHLLLAARAEEEGRWFNPTTAKRTELLIRRRMPQRLEETFEQRVSRMASSDDQRKQDYVERWRAEEKTECTFRPVLNQVTQSIGQAAPLDELVNNRRGQRVRELAKQKARKADVCTHKPALFAERALSRGQQQQLRETPSMCHGLSSDLDNRKGALEETGTGGGRGWGKGAGAAHPLYGPDNKYRLNVREPVRMTADLRAREREQGAKMRSLREEQEVAEMQACTFAPRTNETILRAHRPVVVRGLGRHLELKDAAQQRELDRKAREAQAFGVRKGAVRRTALGETILEPFSLSKGNKKGWWEEKRRRHEAERAAQCTFKPWTVEGERSKALSKLLEWSCVLSPTAVEGSERCFGAVSSVGASIEAPSS